MFRLGRDIDRKLTVTLRIPCGRQPTGTICDSVKRVAQLQRHLAGNFSAQLLLAANLGDFCLVIDQARGAQNFPAWRFH